MSPSGTASEPNLGEIMAALGKTANQLGTFVSKMLDEQPTMALVTAVAAGFIAGGGLSSKLGARLTDTTVRATMGNLTTLMALDLLRRGLEDGGSVGNPEPARAE